MDRELLKILENTLQAQVTAEAHGFEATAGVLKEMRILLHRDFGGGADALKGTEFPDSVSQERHTRRMFQVVS